MPIITQRFTDLVRTIAFKKGMPGMRFAFVPHPISARPAEVCHKYLEGNDPITGKPLIQEFIAGLTQPLSSDDRKTGFVSRSARSRLLAPDTPDNLKKLFNDSGWTDGLPIELPAEEFC